MNAQKKIVIIAGPNGAGKTTFAREFLPFEASPEEAIARVAIRVRQGGHTIPPEIIRRRFIAGLKNFHNVYRQRVDYWQWFDNSGSAPHLLEEGSNP